MKRLVTIYAAAVIVLIVSSRAHALTTTNWVEYTLNPVFTDEGGKAYFPTIIKDGDLYRMWYATRSGVRMTTSVDGINWGTPTDMEGIGNGDYPPNHPLVKKIDSSYRIWYWDTAHEVNPYTIESIRTAASDDGIKWNNDQVISQVGESVITGHTYDWNKGSYGPGYVIYNPSGSETIVEPVNEQTVWANKFVFYYMGTTGWSESIGLAVSNDGINWQGYNDGEEPVLAGRPVTPDQNYWDPTYVGYPTVIKENDDAYHMWYCGGWWYGGTGMGHGIGYAFSTDGIHWTRDNDNLIFHEADGVDWRDERTYTPVVIGDQMWFSGKDLDTGIYAIGYAVPAVYYCIGFEPPMGEGAVKVKKNRVLPFKAELIDGLAFPVTDADIVAPPVIQVIFEPMVGDAVDVSPDALPAGHGTEGNQFEFSNGKWQFNLKTRNYSAPGTYTVTMISGNEREYVIESTCTAVFVIEM